MKVSKEVMDMIEDAFYDGWNVGYNFADRDSRQTLTAFEGFQQFKDEQKLTLTDKCCEPTEEELALIQSGDYRPEELWGGTRPTCPKCI